MQHQCRLTTLLRSVDLFHPACILLSSLKWWHLAIIRSILSLLVSFVDAEPQLDHAVDPLGVHCRLLKSEARGEERGLEEQHDQVLDRLVTLVRLNPLSQVLNNAVVWVDLEMLLGSHVAHGGGVPQRLRLHYPLHVCRPAILRGDNAAGG